MSAYLPTLAIGLLAQGFFSARILVQWIASERARRVLSPSLFWVFSVAGAYLLCLYGWLRSDFAIVFGQFISYYVYLWNLRAKGLWARCPRVLRLVLLLTPVVALALVAGGAESALQRFLPSPTLPLWLLLFGTTGQVLFTLRFVYQWAYSRREGISRLPATFWVISLVGALSIVVYGLLRADVVLIVGQGAGLVAYTRNIMLSRKHPQ